MKRVLWYMALVWALALPYIAHSEEKGDSMRMQVGIVKTSDLCPATYSESPCDVDRTDGDHRALIDRLEDRNFVEYCLAAASAVVDPHPVVNLPLSDSMINALVFATSRRANRSNHSVVFIFYLEQSYQSIEFARIRANGKDRRRGSVISLRR